MSKIFYGIWIYSILCLILLLSYIFYMDLFDIIFFDYSLSFWFSLAVNLVLLCASIISLKGPKILPIIGIITVPVSVYLFYTNWTEKNSLYLAGFIAIPVILLLISAILKKREKYPVGEQSE